MQMNLFNNWGWLITQRVSIGSFTIERKVLTNI